jgi:predicted transcriptional regulator
MPDNTTAATATVKLNEQQNLRLEEIAVEQTEVSNRVTKSDVIREAINDYLDKYQSSPEDCDPVERGSLEAVDEGAA